MPVHRHPFARLALAALLVVALPAVAADAQPASTTEDGTAFDEATRTLGFRLVGPFRGGRSTAVAGVVGQPGTYYMGTTGGGVWKTTDYGVNWRNVSDLERPDPEAVAARPMGREAGGARAGAELADDGTPTPKKVRRGGDPFSSASVGALAVAPSDPNVVWVGMGSACIRGNTSAGDGVYRSTDGGDT
ncbi:MAG TPA: hypothetical protein VKU40_14745, partial [Thermoanaerobaculia bacterium]|nr:hypothetical protein [Thermoanaerobaculia bacterium]